jgi:hypothetical protein
MTESNFEKNQRKKREKIDSFRQLYKEQKEAKGKKTKLEKLRNTISPFKDREATKINKDALMDDLIKKMNPDRYHQQQRYYQQQRQKLRDEDIAFSQGMMNKIMNKK